MPVEEAFLKPTDNSGQANPHDREDEHAGEHRGLIKIITREDNDPPQAHARPRPFGDNSDADTLSKNSSAVGFTERKPTIVFTRIGKKQISAAMMILPVVL
jgi:hypothetical protein